MQSQLSFANLLKQDCIPVSGRPLPNVCIQLYSCNDDVEIASFTVRCKTRETVLSTAPMMKFIHQAFQKLRDRTGQTDRQTDVTKHITNPHSRVVINSTWWLTRSLWQCHCVCNSRGRVPQSDDECLRKFAPVAIRWQHQVTTSLSLWLSGLIRFLSHSTCWAYLAGDLQRPGIKSGSRHELSVGWTNGRYAMRLISRTGTEGPPVSCLNCDRCRLWSYDITAGYKREYWYWYWYQSSDEKANNSRVWLLLTFSVVYYYYSFTTECILPKGL